MSFRGRRVAILKLMHNMRRTLNAEKPCKATRNNSANVKSNVARRSNRASPSAAETYDLSFIFEDPIRDGRGREVSYNRRRSGWKRRSVARYGKLPRKVEYWASEISCTILASANCQFF
jgi:hypothetical protein